MALQDLAIALDVGLVLAAFTLAVTGPHHLLAHVLFIVAGVVLPFACFDLARAGDVPLQAWLYCAFYAGGHAANTLFHVLRPQANHSLGPEVFVQTVGIAFGATVRATLDPTLWYRGTVGVLVFCLTSLYVLMIVVMVYYQ